ncbi:patatin-like phospholipase domain-containing protein [Thermosipho atlanticus]|uniref:Uncharacterized protein n=1 Tax=Thermosipho atlanticus DSM 15807 TaxID=1123380 RepID=A0A1M5QZF7_9BACT|nr:hypothetical protein [Thermosipho atlanticus]SHH19472.1 hypothetical protein SAMN02745199_0248 [Thermosipho atlanticus DSM 15807]
MILAIGGNSVLYFSLPAFFKACEKFGLEFDEIHCTGFSCIPAYFYLKTNSSNRSYAYTRTIYDETLKTFHFAYGFNFTNIIEQILALYKASKTLNGFKNQRTLIKYVTKYFPDEKITKKLKIHAFNLNTFNDEILEDDNLQDAMIKTLSFPIEYSPYNGFVSGSWVYGVPEGDFVILINKKFDVNLKNAIDYMVYSTYARTNEIMRKRFNNAKYKLKITTSSLNPFNLSTKLYEISEKYIGGIL